MRRQYLLFLPLAGLSPLGSAARGQCTLPANPLAGTPDASFDALVTQNGPGWTGGDGTYSLALPDGRVLWMWSDSYIGTVNPTTRLRSSSLFTAHNSLTIQDPATNVVTTLGYPPKTSSFFTPANLQHWFWQGGSVLTQPSTGTYKVKIMLLEWNSTLKLQGTSLATLSWPSLSIDSVQAVPTADNSIEWGVRILQVGPVVYIYGMKDTGFSKTPYLARTSSINYLTQPSRWVFWNATKGQWLAGQTNATAMAGVAQITPEYSVDPIVTSQGTFYLMTGMDPQNPPYPLWNSVITYYSCNPQGPWTNRTVVYTTPESGAPGCKTSTLVAYNAKAHPEATNAEGMLVSYNVNANNGADLVCADDYKPRFIRVPIPGVTSP